MYSNSVYRWYKRPDVKFAIISQLFKRELALLIPNWIESEDIKKMSTRLLRCHSVQHYDFILNKLRFFNKSKPYQFYKSVAYFYDGIPYQDLENLHDRKNSEFISNMPDHIKGFDFFLDIDCPKHQNIDLAYDSAKNISDFFDRYNCPYDLIFSGKGFHFTIPSYLFPSLSFNDKDSNNIYMYFSEIAKKLSNKFSDLIDTCIYEKRRLQKLAFSIALYPNKNYVCYPFVNKHEFDNFNLEDFNLYYFDKPVKNMTIPRFNPRGNSFKLLKKLDMEIELIREIERFYS